MLVTILDFSDLSCTQHALRDCIKCHYICIQNENGIIINKLSYYYDINGTGQFVLLCRLVSASEVDLHNKYLTQLALYLIKMPFANREGPYKAAPLAYGTKDYLFIL